MKKSINFFEKKKIDNVANQYVAGKKTGTAGGGFVTCDGKSYAYASDLHHTNWIFRDTVDYVWIDGNP